MIRRRSSRDVAIALAPPLFAGAVGITTALIALVFMYFAIPVWQAVLLALHLAMQAAIGLTVLSRLLTGISISLLTLWGPGLVLGSALSVLGFQLAGRGFIGEAVVSIIGVCATVLIIRRQAWSIQILNHWREVFAVLGVVALSLSWEFKELLPIAVVGLALLYSPRGSGWPRRVVRGLLGLTAIVVTGWVYVQRPENWWYITDDYDFFEVVARHVTDSGPFANWGTVNWGQYHWLSYAWSGLLNELGGRPELFVTLTRVMPFVYTLSLVCSLLYFVQGSSVIPRGIEQSIIPILAIVAVNRMDWSGTSTAGVYAVLAAIIAILPTIVNDPPMLFPRLVVYAVFLSIISFTKFPSVFAACTVIAIAELVLFRKSKRDSRVFGTTSIVLVVGSLFFVLIYPVGRVIQSFTFAMYNPSLGSIAEIGFIGAIFALVLLKSPILIGGLLSLRASDGAREANSHGQFISMLLPLITFGWFADAAVLSHGNSHEYFSGPYYFVASLSLIAVLMSTQPLQAHHQKTWVSTGILLIGGYIGAATVARMPALNVRGFDTFRLLLTESVVVQALLISVIFVVLPRVRQFPPASFAVALLIGLTLSTVTYRSGDALAALNSRSTPGAASVKQQKSETQVIGEWLRSQTDAKATIATNHLLIPGSQTLSGDYSLAAYSERTFLVLGPRFPGETAASIAAVELSREFAISPTVSNRDQLLGLGVDYFVIDLASTPVRDWGNLASVKFQTISFWILQLSAPQTLADA